MGIINTLTSIPGKVANGVGDFLGFSKPNTGGVQTEINDADKRRADFANQLATYQNRTAPQQQGVSVGPTAQTAAPGNIVAKTATAPSQFFAGQATAAPVVQTNLAPAAQMTAAQVAPVQYAGAGYATGGNAQAGRVDTGGEVQRHQMAALTGLEAAANGQGPSAADAQLRRGTAANIASNYAMARTAHGYGRIGALGQAQQQEEKANSDLGMQEAELRANEQAQARGQLTNALQGVRGQDIQAQTTNAGLGTDVSKFNTGLGADLSKFNVGTESDLSKFNAGSENERNARNAEFVQAARGANMGALNTNNLAQGNITANANALGANLGTDVSKFNAGSSTDVSKYLAGLNEGNQEFNAGQGNDISKFITGLGSQVGMFNTGQSNEMGRAQGSLDAQTGANNLRAQLDTMGMDDARKNAIMNFILGSQGQSIAGANDKVKTEEDAQKERWKHIQDITNFVTGKAGSNAMPGGPGGGGGGGLPGIPGAPIIP